MGMYYHHPLQTCRRIDMENPHTVSRLDHMPSPCVDSSAQRVLVDAEGNAHVSCDGNCGSDPKWRPVRVEVGTYSHLEWVEHD